MNKKRLIIISSIIILVIICLVIGITVIKPFMETKNEYDKIVGEIKTKNDKLDNAINSLKSIIDSDEIPYDETIKDKAKDSIKKAEANKVIIGDMPFSRNKINQEIQRLSKDIDYTNYINDLNAINEQYNNSIKQYKNFITPSEEFIIKKLTLVDEIKYSEAVTEDNDPNGKLNKAGGYTATVYFESSNVNQENLDGTSVIDKGTVAGGSIEVYANEEDANTRNEYLAGFDGSILSNGSHMVIGTVLIRTSDELTATQQKELTNKIKDAIATLD